MIEIDEIRAMPDLSRLFADGYDVSAVYPYTTIHGEIIYCRVRLDHPLKRKQIRPIHRAAYDVLEVGEPQFIRQNLKPLYGLRLLAQHPAACVWIVEGEKCADALNEFFMRRSIQAQHIALTSGGSTSADKADWQVLAMRRVAIWPDNDAEGRTYAAAVVQRLAALDCKVDCIAADRIGLREKGDCVDWCDANPEATLPDILALPLITPTQTNHDMEVICMDDIVMKPINWLWPNRIACGKLTVIAGNPGLGKSQLTASIAAMVTRGLGWPDTLEPAPLGNVVLLSAEDDPADTIKPRLMAAGGDVKRCFIINAVRTKTTDGRNSFRSFDLTQDVERLGAMISSVGNVKLAIIDPFSAYLGKTDSHKNSDIRGLLAPLSDMAAYHGVAVLLITHLNKNSAQDMIGRVMGSIGLIAAARAGYAVVKDVKNPELRYFLPIKNNIGNDADGFVFRIESKVLEGGVATSRVVWQDGAINAKAILNPSPEQKTTTTNYACEFLRQLLAEKSLLAKEVLHDAKGAGFSDGSIRRAAKLLGVIISKQRTANGAWQWSLPHNTDHASPEDVEGVEGGTNLYAASSVGFSLSS